MYVYIDLYANSGNGRTSGAMLTATSPVCMYYVCVRVRVCVCVCVCVVCVCVCVCVLCVCIYIYIYTDLHKNSGNGRTSGAMLTTISPACVHYLSTCDCACVCVCVCVCVCTYICICISISIHEFMNVRDSGAMLTTTSPACVYHICTCMCVCVCVCARVCERESVHVGVYTNICIYISISIHTFLNVRAAGPLLPTTSPARVYYICMGV